MAHTLSSTVSDETLSRIVQIESGGDPDAKVPTSSATGLGQFIAATWLAVVEKHRPDLLEGRSRAQVLALRTDPALSLELLARFTEDNLRTLGSEATDADLYLAHFAGAGVARKLLAAEPSAKASTIFSAQAIKANPTILKNKTAAQVRAWAARKMRNAGGHDWVAQHMGGAERRPPRGRQDSDLELIQRRLKALGYYEVGEIDGKWGGRTAGAIAAFKNDRDLTGAAVVDDDLKLAIDEALAEGWTRPICATYSPMTSFCRRMHSNWNAWARAMDGLPAACACARTAITFSAVR